MAATIRGTAPTHVFYATWSRCATEAQNCAVNGRMLQNLLHTFGNSGHFADVAAILEMEMLLWPEQNHPFLYNV